MELRQLEYFLAVVEHGGVNRAAQQLRLAQASLSQSIRQLERELKVPLFHRTGRKLVLSPAGQLLVEPARKIFDDVLAAQDIMRAARELQVGSITIGTMPEMSSEAVAAWSGTFTRLHPGIRIDLHEYASAGQLCDEVAAGNCEIGFTTFPVPNAAVATVELGVQRLLLVAPPGTPGIRPGLPFPLKRLGNMPLITRHATVQEQDIVGALLRREAVVPRVIAQVPNRHAQLTLVFQGAGAAFLPLRMATTASRAGALVVETDPEVRTPYGIVHRTDRLGAAAQSFIFECKANLDRWNNRIAALQHSGLALLDAAQQADEELQLHRPNRPSTAAAADQPTDTLH